VVLVCSLARCERGTRQTSWGARTESMPCIRDTRLRDATSDRPYSSDRGSPFFPELPHGVSEAKAYKAFIEELTPTVMSIICLFNITLFEESLVRSESCTPRNNISRASHDNISKYSVIQFHRAICKYGEPTAVPGRQSKHIKSTMPREIHLLRVSDRCLNVVAIPISGNNGGVAHVGWMN
jgi:hypothetical protein